jgi:hypothetical protein
MADRKGVKNGEVGYGRPPKHSQYQKGQSGNPRGRPPKPKPEPGESMLSEFMRMGMEEVEFIDTKTGKTQKIRPRTAVLRKLWSDASKDAKTGLIVLNLHRSEAVEGKAKEELTEEDEAILQRLAKRFEQNSAADAATEGQDE